ncbi:junctional adhesion molecule B isoform X2 [Apus apus]|uniref:junctional adhesion molecule B isoform X2 n=1 Tax=Apus apus TaxID=8895 RepID=UPI0021F859FC|nr:junctional adhesion molecule B isoform X2 [Apus apus]
MWKVSGRRWREGCAGAGATAPAWQRPPRAPPARQAPPRPSEAGQGRATPRQRRTPRRRRPAVINGCRRGGAAVPGKMASRSLRLLLLGYLGVLSYHKVSGISIETDNKNVKAEEFKEAILSCKHKFSKEASVRIEWKKLQSRGVSFVYYNGEFTGDLRGRAEMLNTGIHIRNVTRKDSGTYRCEISARSDERQHVGEAIITLTVLVAPTTPVCEIPSSAMTGTVVELSCKETEGSPPSEYQWYKNGVALREKTGTGSARAANLTYTMNKKSGTLLFNTVTKNDTGEYFCEAFNGIGLSQRCSAKRMQVEESSSQKKTNYQSTSEKDFKHTKSFVI